jgi:hypothetical protein
MTDPTDSLVAIAVDQEELHGSRVALHDAARRGVPVEAVSPASCWDR